MDFLRMEEVGEVLEFLPDPEVPPNPAADMGALPSGFFPTSLEEHCILGKIQYANEIEFLKEFVSTSSPDDEAPKGIIISISDMLTGYYPGGMMGEAEATLMVRAILSARNYSRRIKVLPR